MEDKIKCFEDQDFLLDVTDFFKVFGDTTRIKILTALYSREMCVADLANKISLSQSATSHQLATLKQARLVKFRREGTTLYYSLDDDHIIKILSLAVDHLKEK